MYFQCEFPSVSSYIDPTVCLQAVPTSIPNGHWVRAERTENLCAVNLDYKHKRNWIEIVGESFEKLSAFYLFSFDMRVRVLLVPCTECRVRFGLRFLTPISRPQDAEKVIFGDCRRLYVSTIAVIKTEDRNVNSDIWD